VSACVLKRRRTDIVTAGGDDRSKALCDSKLGDSLVISADEGAEC
jgi:hypothetical protein